MQKYSEVVIYTYASYSGPDYDVTFGETKAYNYLDNWNKGTEYIYENVGTDWIPDKLAYGKAHDIFSIAGYHDARSAFLATLRDTYSGEIAIMLKLLVDSEPTLPVN